MEVNNSNYHPVRVLDKGFVKLVSFMGGDQAVVQAARVSFGSESKGEEKDKILIKYLLDHGHGTPFEQSVFKFHVKCPIFVARQWMRHRIGSFNEISGRYTEFDDTEYYTPDRPRFQEKKNKQGSVFDEDRADNIKYRFPELIKHATDTALHTYKELLNYGVAKELARIVLPVNMYTQFYWCVNARSLMNFLKVRLDEHAQYEMRQYAKAIDTIFEEKMPWTHEANGDDNE